MALLPTYKRLNNQDYPEDDKDLVDRLGASLNDAIQSVFDALNKKLTFDDNFLGSIKDVNVTVDANGTPTVQTFLNTGVGASAKGIIVVRADNLTNSNGYPLGAPFVSWAVTNNGIQILNVRGLIPGNQYRLRILTLG